MFSTNLALLQKVGKIGDGLNGFSKTHVIGQDSIHFFESEFDHPDKRLLLIVLKLSSLECLRLYFSECILESIECFWVIDFPIDAGSNFAEELSKLIFLLLEVDKWFWGKIVSLGHCSV